MAKAKKKAAKKVASQKVAAKKRAAASLTAKQQLDLMIAKLDRKAQPLFRSVQKALRKRFPAANELVYDYSHSLVIGYSPNENGIESVVAFSASADGLRLYFMNGPRLPDPKKMLLGSAKQTRYVEVDSLKTLKVPEVEGFMKAATGMAKTPFSAGGGGKLVIKTSSVNKPAKRKAARRS